MMRDTYKEETWTVRYSVLVVSSSRMTCQPVGHRLLHVRENLDQRPRQGSILPLIKEACCTSSVANPPSSTNPVDVLVQLFGQVIVNNMHDIWDVKAPCRNCCSH